MSEAMTNPEIEDVLASIRRLVAQDRKPRPERLILTEEFRVRQANIPAPPLYPAPPPVARTGATLPEGEVPDPAAPGAAGARPALAAAIAEVVREVEGGLASPPAPSGAAPADSAPVGAAPVPPLQAAEPAAPPAPEPVVAASAAAVVPVEAPVAVDLGHLEAEIRALELQIPGARILGAEPVPPAAAPMAAPAAPAAEVEAVEEPKAEAVAAPKVAPAAAPEIVGDDVAFIDEADLEAMVARIVREELRGQLGERITQQVRKLVRAEIARALDERNLLT